MTTEFDVLHTLPQCTHLAQATILGERTIGSGEIEGHLYIKWYSFLKRNAIKYHYISIPREFGFRG